MWKTGLKSFSLAHLLCIFFWFSVTNNGFDFPTEVYVSEVISFFLLLSALTLVIFICFYFEFFKSLKFAGTICGSLIILRGIKGLIHYPLGFNIVSMIFFLITALFTSVAIYLFLKKRLLVKKIVHHTLLFFFPFAIFTTLRLIFEIIEISQPTVLAKTIESKKERFFWIVFDELDENLVFSLNPENQVFPALNQFRSESIYCTQAIQPGGCTAISLPAYLLGQEMTEIVSMGVRDLIVKDKNLQKYNLKTAPVLFDKVQKLQYNSAFLGWYLPYDRLLKNKVNYFSVYSKVVWPKASILPTRKQFFSHVGMFIQFNFQKIFQKFFHLSFFEKAHWRFSKYMAKDSVAYEQLCTSIREIIADQKLHFVFLHLPYPHYPTIYDPQKDKIIPRDPCYYDNVHLADKVLSMIRRELENQGGWDKTTILITSDHWLRELNTGFIDQYLQLEKEDFLTLMAKRKKPLVPFMLKLPYQKKGIKYDKEINAVIAHDLMLYLMQNISSCGSSEVCSQNEIEKVVSFFDDHQSAVNASEKQP
jgi:hypothetical protein